MNWRVSNARARSWKDAAGTFRPSDVAITGSRRRGGTVGMRGMRAGGGLWGGVVSH